jgi:hypothetical protein
MSLNLGIIASARTSASGGSLLLDTYPGAAAAYSLRKLRSAYTGAAIRVRRSSDGTETDIGFFSNGELDTTTLSTFVSSGFYGYVSVWYDQSGNGYDLTQTELSIQPTIIALGVVQLFGTKPTINFQSIRSGGGGPCSLQNIVLNFAQPNTYFIVNQGTATNATGDRNLFDGTSANRNAVGKSNVNINYFLFAGSLVYSTTPYDTIKNLFVPIFNTTTSYLYKNNTAILSAVNPGSQSLGGLRLACYTKYEANYESIMPEFIVYNSNKSTDRIAIQDNINSYYTIY